MARPRGKLRYLALKIRNAEESENGSKVVWGRGCRYSPRGGSLKRFHLLMRVRVVI